MSDQTNTLETNTVGETPTPTFSDDRFRAFLDAAFDAYYDWDLTTDRLEMSTQIEELLRLQPGSLPRRFESWLERLHPEDAIAVSRNINSKPAANRDLQRRTA